MDVPPPDAPLRDAPLAESPTAGEPMPPRLMRLESTQVDSSSAGVESSADAGADAGVKTGAETSAETSADDGADDSAEAGAEDDEYMHGKSMRELLHAAGFPQAVERTDGRCVVPVSNMPSALQRCTVVVEPMVFSCGDLSIRHIWIPLLGAKYAASLSTAALLALMDTAGKLPYIALEIKGANLALCAKVPAFLPPRMLGVCVGVLILTADTLVAREPELESALHAARAAEASAKTEQAAKTAEACAETQCEAAEACAETQCEAAEACAETQCEAAEAGEKAAEAESECGAAAGEI